MSQRPKILFVDEDAQILAALQRLLHDEDWACRFAHNGSEALALLTKEPADLIVSAAAMTQMDGIALLTEVQRLYPATIRLFLTADSRHDNVLTALADGRTQQIIPVPWIDLELKEILRSALRQAACQRRYSQDLQKLINSIPLLPTLPETYNQVRACITDDEIDIERMAEAISQDINLSTTLLHWGNSALFGQRFLVDTIKKAIIVLGTDIVETLVLSESSYRAVNTGAGNIPGFNLSLFRKHSIATATIARLLVKFTHSSRVDIQDRAFISGLLHDLGKLFLAHYLPDQFQRAIDLANQNQSPLSEAEQSLYQTDHAELGAMIAEWWSLPPFLVEALRSHHQPRTTPIEAEISAATYVGNYLACQFSFDSHIGQHEEQIDQSYLDRFHLNEETIDILKTKTLSIISDLPA
ncbi:MAG: response regulator [Pelovirga sp.]